ncbi:ARM repeat-containing protein [Punctularia strigosozonata HHB-11173 SS5]|uniref:Importin-13 n=1 Tax=Punctularia strigosozonata (strain HHB-11173) TaxID=741275 RepID=R7S5V9_PUNST|nr:ARM repeat-containing protein [Punctularia strigosozonata HHB-11173 SS5]EIN05146.1 ARM repeat-containing protein [Punctularia strigosozonata HHB-11173 SS5]
MNTTFLPTLAPVDVQQAAQLIQQAYSPQAHVSADAQRTLQQDLFDIQKRPEAWGLVVPFLEDPDPNVQFFGAHTAQVKIARDWDSFPKDNALDLKDLLVELTGGSMVLGRNKVILRKLSVAVTSLALKLVPAEQSEWSDWIVSCCTSFSSRGASAEQILDFLSIVAEEVDRADLLGFHRSRMRQSLMDAIPLVMQAISSSVGNAATQRMQRTTTTSSLNESHAALKCFQAWLPTLPANDITPLIPVLISLLTPVTTPGQQGIEFDESIFVPASDALQEIMSNSSMADGAGVKTLTEPLLQWVASWGGTIIQETLNSGIVDDVSHSFCKLLVALGDHSIQYLANNLASNAHMEPSLQSQPVVSATKGQLVQTFLRSLLSYTSLPGYYGVDEEDSESTLGFWYLFQETLWSVEYDFDAEQEEQVNRSKSGSTTDKQEQDQWQVAKAVYVELVTVLRRKIVWPPTKVLSSWTKDLQDKFQVYRRDVGDTLINAYYILRDDMLGLYLADLEERLARNQNGQEWEEIEATLHSIMSIQEAVPVEPNAHLERLFGPDILGRLPTSSHDRVRRTTLGLIGEYATWFMTQSTLPPTSTQQTSLLMNAVSYVVAALSEPGLCLHAANALRELCDANRAALAPHISAFAQLNAGLSSVPDTEKSKVLQSIASVIQALPPEQEIEPIDGMVGPVVAKLWQALQLPAQAVEDAQAMAIVQLQTLSGVAKGLTRMTDSLLSSDEEAEIQAETRQLEAARQNPRMVKLRESILGAVQETVKRWSSDAAISDALSDLFKSITALYADMTIISLPPGALLELVCFAAQQQLTAVWLSLASMLMIQLNPPPLLSTFKPAPNPEAQAIVGSLLPVLLQTSLNFLGQAGAMEANPDIVQAFFDCMEKIAIHFIASFYRLPPGHLDSLMRCAIQALSLQERYALVSASTFLASLVNRTSSSDEVTEMKDTLALTYGYAILRAILSGFAGLAPRSCTPNLIELLSTLLSRWPEQCRTWIPQILFAEDFPQSKAGPEAKEKLVKALAGSRSLKKTRDAAHHFMLVARGLEGTTFGYATVTM